MVEAGKFNTTENVPTVIKLTNTRNEALDVLKFYYKNVTDRALLDFSFDIYDADMNYVATEYTLATGEITKTSDSSPWSLGVGETCYIILTTENTVENVFMWLMS